MAPGAHLVLSWLSSVNFLKNRRERLIVSYVGLSPDLDGLGIIADKITGTTHYYIKYHHYLGHCGLAAIVITAIGVLLAKTQKIRVAVLSLFVFHLHIFCDVIGSKGPDGDHWPIFYLYPFNTKFNLTWSGQWELSAWQNSVIMAIGLSACLYYAVKNKYSFLEVFSRRLDQEAYMMYKKYISKGG